MKNREYGLDLARIVSMVGIIILHILGSGGLLANNNPGIGKYWVYWYIEIFSFSSVVIVNKSPGVQFNNIHISSIYLKEIEVVSPLIIRFKFLEVIFIL